MINGVSDRFGAYECRHDSRGGGSVAGVRASRATGREQERRCGCGCGSATENLEEVLRERDGCDEQQSVELLGCYRLQVVAGDVADVFFTQVCAGREIRHLPRAPEETRSRPRHHRSCYVRRFRDKKSFREHTQAVATAKRHLCRCHDALVNRSTELNIRFRGANKHCNKCCGQI